jgi:transglutaminase-like putative cysteine protease
MSESAKPPRPKLHERREFLPVTILIGIAVLVSVISSLSGRPPVIDSVSPTVGNPREIMVIRGRSFHADREGGEVRIGGVSPHTQDYQDWTDTSIKLRIPDDCPSGMVSVSTRDGRSNGVLFTNRALIPRILSGPARPGEPYITAIDPEKAPPGGLVTLTGMNFGPERKDSWVYFTWGSAEATGKNDANALDALVPATDQDGDYESWSELEIRVRIPDGATSGSVRVRTARGTSNAVYLELEAGVGSKRYVDQRTYHVEYGVDVTNISLLAGGGTDSALYVWVPNIAFLPEQRAIELVRRQPETPLFDDLAGLSGYLFERLGPGDTAFIRQQYIFHRYAVETNLNPERVDLEYDRDRKLFPRYTQPDSFVPSDNEKLKTAARSVVGTTRNPYWKARLLYAYVIQRLAYDKTFTGDAVAANDARKGDAFAFATLFAALCRAAEIPARPVAGYLVQKDQQRSVVQRHYWAEFYVEKLGWLPVDPLLGRGERILQPVAGQNPTEYYFGNLDMSHITFSKGEVTVPQQTPRGRLVRRQRGGSLQTAYEEAVGSLSSYSAKWLDIEAIGVY